MTMRAHSPVKSGPMRRRGFLGVALALLALPRLAQAQGSGRPLLTITGADGTALTLDEAGLAALPWHEVTTHTRWTDGPQHFRGPLLREVLGLMGLAEKDLQDRQLKLTALNEFQVDIPAGDAWDFDPILAREMNGQAMRIRDRGPLWLIYPRDRIPALQNPVIDERWIWQLVDIRVF